MTNYAINKKSENFIYDKSDCKADFGHKRSLSAIWNIISASGGNVEKI